MSASRQLTEHLARCRDANRTSPPTWGRRPRWSPDHEKEFAKRAKRALAQRPGGRW
jgi:hypothetical protein